MGFGERLRELRESYGYSQKALAKIVNVTDSAIANYENGVNYPKIEIIIELMNVLKCDANFFYQDYIPKSNIWELSEEERVLITKYRKLNSHGKKATNVILDVEYERAEPWVQNKKKISIDIFSLVSKKNGYIISQSPKKIETFSNTITEKAAFGIKMISNFEKPIFSAGEIILFSKSNVSHNQVGLFLLNGHVYIRKMYKRNGILKLIPFNASFETIEILDNNDLEILGKYIGKLDEYI